MTADVLRRAAVVIQKSTTGVTLDAAISAVFASDRDLYERYRAASRA